MRRPSSLLSSSKLLLCVGSGRGRCWTRPWSSGGGEFGRTTYSQGKLERTNYGRDHHDHCFTVWLAGGGVRPGIRYGETDDFGYKVVRDPVHVHDLNATLPHLLGLHHERLAFRFQGRDHRLTDRQGTIVRKILA
jgi:hypothetical protein